MGKNMKASMLFGILLAYFSGVSFAESSRTNSSGVIFLEDAFHDKVTKKELLFKESTYYLIPEGLHRNPDSNNYQLGLIHIYKTGFKMINDFQVTGCKKGKGIYIVGDDGVSWNKPKSWVRGGGDEYGRVASFACEIINDCEQTLSSAHRKKLSGNSDSISGKYFSDQAISNYEGMCGKY